MNALLLGLLLMQAPKPSFYLATESSKPLAGVRSGETVEFFFELTNGRVYGIETLSLRYEPGSDVEIVGPKLATFRSIAGTGGAIRAGIKLKLKASTGQLLVTYTAKFVEDGGAANGRAVIVIGRAEDAAHQIRWQAYEKTARPIKTCLAEELQRNPSFEPAHLSLTFKVDRAGAAEVSRSDPWSAELESCLKEKSKGLVLHFSGQPTDVDLRLTLTRDDVLLSSSLGTSP